MEGTTMTNRQHLDPQRELIVVAALTLVVALLTPSAYSQVSNCAGEADGTSCEDGNSCTVNEVCGSGVCGGGTCYCNEPATGLVGWWPGDGTANDIGAYALNGTMKNGAVFAAGEVDQAFSFDGVNGYMAVPENPTWGFSSQITLAAWIQPQSAAFANHGKIFSKFGTQGNWAYQTIVNSNGRFGLDVSGNGTTYSEFLSPSGLLLPDTWAHVAATFEAGAVKLYVNGILVDSETTRIASLFNSGIGPPSVGGDPIGGQFFAGLIDEVQVYNHALSTSEIQAIYAAGTHGICKRCTDSDGDGYGLAGDTCHNGTAQDCAPDDPATHPGVTENCRGCNLDSIIAAPDGTACDDGNACTQTSACQAGACMGSNPTSGNACDDGNPCTTADTCTAGGCAGMLVDDGVRIARPASDDPTAVISWNLAPGATGSDVVRGLVSGLPVSPTDAGETLLVRDTDSTTYEDSTVPDPGMGFWYLVRARTACGGGSWGFQIRNGGATTQREPREGCVVNVNASPRYADQGLTVTDFRTCLEWEKKDQPGESAIHSESLTFDLPGALNWLGLVNWGEHFAGHTDWRLPTSAGKSPSPTTDAAELESIIDHSYIPAIDPIFGPTEANFYWTSSRLGPNGNFIWGVDFTHGIVTLQYQLVVPGIDLPYPVRAVRGDPVVLPTPPPSP
jgi:Concanavalin A-like lectin/glucanases superfamily/Protein of unknown function (DUF1566)